MENPSFPKKLPERCTYLHACYLAESLSCFGYKMDCPLYQKSNGHFLPEAEFHTAMDQLIDKARAKHLPQIAKSLK